MNFSTHKKCTRFITIIIILYGVLRNHRVCTYMSVERELKKAILWYKLLTIIHPFFLRRTPNQPLFFYHALC